MKPRVAGYGLLVALGLGGWLLAYRQSLPTAPASQPEPCASAPVEHAAQVELATLRNEVTRLQAELRALRLAAQMEAPPPREVPGEPPVASPPPTPEQESAWLDARAKFFDEVLKAQPRDSTWASDIEQKAVRLAGDQKAQGVQLVDTRCYTNHCRMEYAYRDSDARSAHLANIGPAFTELPRVWYSYPGAPAVQDRAVLYMSKLEHSFPDFDYASFAADAGRR